MASTSFANLPGTLGCGEYTVIVQPRGGGGTILGELPCTSIQWGRLLDDTSSATVSASPHDDDCCVLVGSIRPWKHELSIWRSGVEVWVGPVVIPNEPVDGFTIEARDVTAWWDHRLVHNDIDFEVPVDLATLFDLIADDAMSVDRSPGLQLSTTPCGVTGVKTILAAQHQIAGPVLRDLSNIGIDWTAIGRLVLAGGATIPTSSLGPFTDDHFASPPQPKVDGTAQANTIIVRGEGGGTAGDTIAGMAQDAAAALEDGVLESAFTVTTVQDNDAARAAASTRLALASAPVLVDQSVLAPDAPFLMEELVPGALCDLAVENSSCIKIVGSYRLQQLAVTFGDTEQVALTFQPPGTL